MMGKYRFNGWILSIVLIASLILSGCVDTTTTPAATPPVNTLPPATQPASTATEPAPTETVPDTGEPTQVPPTGAPTELPTAEPTAAPSAAPTADNAASFPDANAFEWREIVTGLALPVGLAVAEDGTNRLFVVEKRGTIRIIQDDQLAQTPFLDITGRVGSRGSEQGLLGLAFSPNYEQDGFFYVNYTDTNGDTVISRFSVTGDTNQADPSSEQVLITQDQPYANHNGGGVVFGPDGFLYLSLGDGGSAGDPQDNGQSVTTFLGKILRIDVSSGDAYTIPADNPFVNTEARPEIWAYGLRNPWRFSFDRQTGDLYIADVGQNQWEEIDFQPAGAPGGTNYGWSYKEGTHPYKGQPPANVTLTDPVYEYSHGGGNCSVTGGYVYRGQMAEWQGIYLFGDYCSGSVWGLLRSGDSFQGQQLWQVGGAAISSFGQDENGEVYLINISGSIDRLVKK